MYVDYVHKHLVLERSISSILWNILFSIPTVKVFPHKCFTVYGSLTCGILCDQLQLITNILVVVICDKM